MTISDDPRHRNVRCDTSSVGAYLHDYAARLQRALASVDTTALERARQLVEGAATADRRVFSAGNGGSAAIADHLCCDWTKGTYASGQPVIEATPLTGGVALFTAIANDHGWEQVFDRQIAMVGRPGDVLVAISSSGDSPNILAAVERAHAVGMASVGLTGFGGGALRRTAQVVLHVDAENYGIVEDAHQALMHVLAQFIAARRDDAAGRS